MEFPFPLSGALEISQDGFSILTSIVPGSPKDSSSPKAAKEYLADILDTLGRNSAKAQDVKHPLTTYSRFTTGRDSKIYIKAESHTVYGFLRIENKKLMYVDKQGNSKEGRFICLVDFYVHESLQRSGVGKTIFNKMLETEKIKSFQLAYKRPTLELFSFLKRYYKLVDYVPQPNYYVIFNAYWDHMQRKKFAQDKLLTFRTSEDERSNSEMHGHSRDDNKTSPDILSPKVIGSVSSKKSRKSDNNINNGQLVASKKGRRRSIERLENLGFDVENVLQKFEEEGPKEEALIDLLLKAPSVLDNDIFAKSKQIPAEISGKVLFKNKLHQSFYDEIYKWHWHLEKELQEEEKYLKEKLGIKFGADADANVN